MKQEMDKLISEILASYEKNLSDETKHPDYLPDKGEVEAVITLLRKLLFPGYFYCKEADSDKDGVHGWITHAKDKLQCQICRALNSDAGSSTCSPDVYDKAGAICRDFLRKLPELLEVLMTDVQAAYDGDPAASSKHEIIFAYPGIYAISVYRLAHQLHLLSVPLIPRMMTEHAHNMTGIDIHPGAEIGRHFFIDHGTGVVIGETTVIGAHVKLYQGVTLGGLSTRGGQSLRGKKRHPTIEDEVTIYSGATILGGETVIGKGSVVGGNVFITQSVPPHTRVNIKSHELEYRTM
ncbi:MAG: serine acetyltransferase [Oscillospiraceae bacterium]|nr:serine acetyltransferase [Oscillospiraceae bacterium]